MKRPQSHLMRSERGQSLVEFALTLPMLLVVMFMVTEFGRAIYQYNVLAQATREGARVAVVSAEGSAQTDGETQMDNFFLGTGISPGEVTRTVRIVEDYGGIDGLKVVKAEAVMEFRWALAGTLPTSPSGEATVSPTALNLRAETVMKVETF